MKPHLPRPIPRRKPGGRRTGGIDLVHCESGAAIIEFALALPLLLVLIGGCFELGRAMLVYQTMTEAVRGGARYLARVPDPTCSPACAAGAARASAMTRNAILENSRLPPPSVRAMPLANPPLGTVVMEAEVVLNTDLLALLRLDHVLTLRVAHQETRIAD